MDQFVDKKRFGFIFCGRKGPYHLGIRTSDEIKQARIAGAMGEQFDEIRFPFPILKWLFAAQGN